MENYKKFSINVHNVNIAWDFNQIWYNQLYKTARRAKRNSDKILFTLNSSSGDKELWFTYHNIPPDSQLITRPDLHTQTHCKIKQCDLFFHQISDTREVLFEEAVKLENKSTRLRNTSRFLAPIVGLLEFKSLSAQTKRFFLQRLPLHKEKTQCLAFPEI